MPPVSAGLECRVENSGEPVLCNICFSHDLLAFCRIERRIGRIPRDVMGPAWCLVERRHRLHPGHVRRTAAIIPADAGAARFLLYPEVRALTLTGFLIIPESYISVAT